MERGAEPAEHRDDLMCFRASCEQAHAGIAHVGRGGEWLWVNDRVCEFVDRSREELLGTTLQAVVYPHDYGELETDLVAAALAGDGRPQAVERHLQRKSGEDVWVRLTLSTVRDAAGETKFLLAVLEDASVVRAARAVLEERTRDLERSNRDLEQFAYVASHDLQEPLRMVTSYMQLLELHYGDTLDGDAREFMQFAVDGAVRMKALIRDLLAYSRIGATDTDCTALVDMNEVLAEVREVLCFSIEDRGATVSASRLPEVVGERPQLVQLLQNLICNALRYGPRQGGRVLVSAAQEGPEWRFCVEDNGIGIAPKDWGRVFAILQRLHRDDAIPGTGIGLAVCQKIVEGHRGRIWVESALGEGSRFYFTLPVAVPQVEEFRRLAS